MKREEGETMVININLTRGLVVVLTLTLLTAAFLGYLAWGRGEVSASNLQAPLASSAGMRQYYLAPNYVNGAGASTACAAGYHMASLWEILDTSNLKYNAALGYTWGDSGQGPPTDIGGWVRTGYGSSNISTPGTGNCYSWSSSDASHYGTVAWLEEDWTVAHDVHVWQVSTGTCDALGWVWCLED